MWQFIADIAVYRVGAGQSCCQIYPHWCLPWNCFSDIRCMQVILSLCALFSCSSRRLSAGTYLSIHLRFVKKNGNRLCFFVNKVSLNMNVSVRIYYTTFFYFRNHSWNFWQVKYCKSQGFDSFGVLNWLESPFSCCTISTVLDLSR